MAMSIVPVLLLSLSVSQIYACIPKAAKELANSKEFWDLLGIKKPGSGPTDMPGPNDGMYGDKNGGPVESPDDLSCDFEGECCWTNIPSDDGDYSLWADVDKAAWENKMGSPAPTTQFAAFGAVAPTMKDGKKVLYQSCYIECAEGPVKVSMKHWRYDDNTKLQACALPKAGGALEGCVDFGSDSESTAEIVSPATEEPFHIVIVATNMENKLADIVAIDDITVDYQDCSEPTTTTEAAYEETEPTEEPYYYDETTKEPYPDDGGNSQGGSGEDEDVAAKDAAACKALGVTSSGSATIGKWVPGGNPTEKFAVRPSSKLYQNRVTGIRPDGKDFLGSFIQKRQKSTLLLKNLEIAEGRLIVFDIARPTNDMLVNGCLQGMCDEIFDPKVDRNARSWVTKEIMVPPGKGDLEILVDNSKGVNEGAVGISNVQLLDQEGNSVC
jgi:hypothetical protein